MKIKTAVIIGIVLCLHSVLSAMVIRNYCQNKEMITENESGVFNEDYLFLGNELNFSGESEDLIFLGKTLTFSGITQLGVISICERLVYSGKTGNGVIAAGMDIDINGRITGNNYVGCKSFTLRDSGEINGNLFIGCARIAIEGKLHGDLYAGAGEIVINNEIKGNVFAYGGRIIIGEKGKIDGDLFYSAKEKLSEKDSKRVTGKVTVDAKHKSEMEWNSLSKEKRKSIGIFIAFALCVSYILVASILLFIPVFKKLEEKQMEKKFWKTALWGLIPVLMYPAVIVLCLIMVLTIPLAVCLILAFIPLFFVTNVIGATLIGKFLVAKLKWKIEKRHILFLIGTLVGLLISGIPVVNFLALVFTTALGWGTFLSFLFQKDLAAA